jgi:hypothetical protein
MKYDKHDQQGKAAYNERRPHMTQQQKPVARNPGGHETKAGQGARQNTDTLTTKMTHKRNNSNRQ